MIAYVQALIYRPDSDGKWRETQHEVRIVRSLVRQLSSGCNPWTFEHRLFLVELRTGEQVWIDQSRVGATINRVDEQKPVASRRSRVLGHDVDHRRRDMRDRARRRARRNER